MKMKKVFLGLSVALMMCACGPNNDKLIDQYEATIKAENYGEAREILNKIDQDKLTEEQSERILDISSGGAYSSLQELFLKGMNEFGSAMNEALSETENAMEDAADVIDEALDAYEDALDGLLDE